MGKFLLLLLVIFFFCVCEKVGQFSTDGICNGGCGSVTSFGYTFHVRKQGGECFSSLESFARGWDLFTLHTLTYLTNGCYVASRWSGKVRWVSLVSSLTTPLIATWWTVDKEVMVWGVRRSDPLLMCHYRFGMIKSWGEDYQLQSV